MAYTEEIQMYLYCIELDSYANRLLLYTTYSDLLINVCRCLSLGHLLLQAANSACGNFILCSFQDLPGSMRRDLSDRFNTIR